MILSSFCVFSLTMQLLLFVFQNILVPPEWILLNPLHATDLFRYLLKTGFLMFSGGIERGQWYEMG